MDLQRLRPADWLTGVAGLASLLLLWAPWYSVGDGTVNGWQTLGLIDVLIALTALLAIALWVVTATRDTPELPVAMDVLTATPASLTALLVIFRLLDVPGGRAITGREWGVVAATVAMIAVAAGAWAALRDESAPGLRPRPEIEPMPAPPAAGPSPADS
jgi:hypothetical protein